MGVDELGQMSTPKRAKNLSEREVDRIVVAEAHNNSAWEKPVRVQRTKPAALSIPAGLAARAAFLARLHRQRSVSEWLTQVIQERVELEEAAFAGAKQDVAPKGR
jgi:hypothetical protein